MPDELDETTALVEDLRARARDLDNALSAVDAQLVDQAADVIEQLTQDRRTRQPLGEDTAVHVASLRAIADGQVEAGIPEAADLAADAIERLVAERGEARQRYDDAVALVRADRDRIVRDRDSLARRLSVRFGELEEARAAARQLADERDQLARQLRFVLGGFVEARQDPAGRGYLRSAWVDAGDIRSLRDSLAGHASSVLERPEGSPEGAEPGDGHSEAQRGSQAANVIEVRGGVVRLDLRCTACGGYVGERLYADPTGDTLAWPRLGLLNRIAEAHRCGDGAPTARSGFGQIAQAFATADGDLLTAVNIVDPFDFGERLGPQLRERPEREAGDVVPGA